jgi:tRNA 5-methylaminomethyl-2-thiouridine biosynthesis bifunctional protein
LDEAEQPAAGASGLPVGLAAPYATADDSPLARLTRHGVGHLVQQTQQLLVPGVDWSLSGAHEIPLGGGTGAMQWQPMACWVKPAAMVRAWLATTGVQFRGGCEVHQLCRRGLAWELQDASGQVLATADRVVLANACGLASVVTHSSDLLAQGAGRGWPMTHTVRGLVTWGPHAGLKPTLFPRTPVHGNGSLIAHVPYEDGPRWFVGASYQPVRPGEAQWPDDKNHGANALRLEKLAPALFAALTPRLEAGELKAWKGQRFVTADRMPLLGPVAQALPDVWACAGFGSRGLSLVAVCAELLAAQWAADVWPVEASLAQALLPYRKHR